MLQKAFREIRENNDERCGKDDKCGKIVIVIMVGFYVRAESDVGCDLRIGGGLIGRWLGLAEWNDK